MELHLVDDLPLMGSCADEPALAAMVGRSVERLADVVPARLHYVSFSRLERLWAQAAATTADVCVLVGTRPDRLWARNPGPRSAVRVRTAREHDAGGFTRAVRVVEGGGSGPRRDGRPHRVCVLDDVLMSGTTVRAVLAGWPAADQPEVRVVIATADGIRAVRAEHAGVPVGAEVLLHLTPIRDGTVIFLTDLLFGTLRGRPFLAQADLLRAFFGDDLAPLHRLRAAVESDRNWQGPRW